MHKSLTAIFLLAALGASAQAGISDSFAKAEFQSRVKSVEEFVDRFNGISDFEGVTRRDLLMGLFDASNPLNLAADKGFYTAVEEFVTEVDSRGIRLSLPSDSVTAFVRVKLTTPVVSGKEAVIRLKPEFHPVRAGEWGWSLSGIDGVTEGDFVTQQRVALLNPFSADNHFQKLPSDLASATEDVWLYRSCSVPVDPLTLLLYGLSDGSVTISSPSDMWLQFTNVPEFTFVIREYDREGSNAGWLISQLEPIRVSQSQSE